MNYLFIYYTGTYNTRFLTEQIGKRLEKEGHSFDTVEITVDTPPLSVKGYDVVGLGFPIYGFNSPMPFNQYLKKVNFEEGQPFFIYKNSGESMKMNDAADRIPLKIMKKHHGVFLGEYHFLMPYNIHFPFDRELMIKLMKENQKLLEILIKELKNPHPKEPQRRGVLLDVGAFLVSVQKLGGNFNSFFYKVEKEQCVLCGKCVENCPEKNISIKDGKVLFGHHCDMCMRCSFFCPKKAIHIGMLENWKVTDYYNLEELWEEAKDFSTLQLKKETPFFKSYMRTFKEIDNNFEMLPQSLKKDAESTKTN